MTNRRRPERRGGSKGAPSKELLRTCASKSYSAVTRSITGSGFGLGLSGGGGGGRFAAAAAAPLPLFEGE